MYVLNIELNMYVYVFWSVCYARTAGMTVLLLNIFTSLKHSLTSSNQSRVIFEKELKLRTNYTAGKCFTTFFSMCCCPSVVAIEIPQTRRI